MDDAYLSLRCQRRQEEQQRKKAALIIIKMRMNMYHILNRE
jgi:hypothetical protein